MTPGRVITIRINPDDCMSAIDAADHLGIPTNNLSFAQLVKVIFRSAMEDYRTKGLIPRRTGFEYTRMMERFPYVTQKAHRQATVARAAALAHPDAYVAPMEAEEPARRSRRLRYEELALKREADPVNWTPEEQAEFQPLVLEFFQ